MSEEACLRCPLPECDEADPGCILTRPKGARKPNAPATPEQLVHRQARRNERYRDEPAFRERILTASNRYYQQNREAVQMRRKQRRAEAGG